MQLAGPGVFGPPRDRDAARAVLRRAIELGVDHIDTSQYYGPDVVNDLIRETLHPYPERPQARDEGRRAPRRAGRLAARPDPAGAARRASRPTCARCEVERMDLVNLRRMATDGADVPAGRAARRAGGPAPRGQARPHRHQQRHPATRLEQALELVDIAGVQNAVQHPRPRPTRTSLELCRERELAFVPFFPLGSAFTGGPAKLAADPAIAAVAPSSTACSRRRSRWPGCCARDERILLIPGTTSVAPPRGEPGRRRRRRSTPRTWSAWRPSRRRRSASASGGGSPWR